MVILKINVIYMVYRFTLILSCIVLLFSCKHDTHLRMKEFLRSIDTLKLHQMFPKSLLILSLKSGRLLYIALVTYGKRAI